MDNAVTQPPPVATEPPVPVPSPRTEAPVIPTPRTEQDGSFYERHRPQLEEMVARHVQTGSVDEGTGEIFDRIIDGWRDQERARLQVLHAQTHRAHARRRLEHEADRARLEYEVSRARSVHQAAARELAEAQRRLLGPGEPVPDQAGQQGRAGHAGQPPQALRPEQA